MQYILIMFLPFPPLLPDSCLYLAPHPASHRDVTWGWPCTDSDCICPHEYGKLTTPHPGFLCSFCSSDSLGPFRFCADLSGLTRANESLCLWIWTKLSKIKQNKATCKRPHHIQKAAGLAVTALPLPPRFLPWLPFHPSRSSELDLSLMEGFHCYPKTFALFSLMIAVFLLSANSCPPWHHHSNLTPAMRVIFTLFTATISYPRWQVLLPFLHSLPAFCSVFISHSKMRCSSF